MIQGCESQVTQTLLLSSHRTFRGHNSKVHRKYDFELVESINFKIRTKWGTTFYYIQKKELTRLDTKISWCIYINWENNCLRVCFSSPETSKFELLALKSSWDEKQTLSYCKLCVKIRDTLILLECKTFFVNWTLIPCE